MKKIFFCASFFFLIANLFFCQDTPLRGPFNQPSNGVIDGVVLKEELPTRLTVPYQSVRAADYVWSKRLYSRIDAREKMNQPLFLPFDSFDGTTDGSFYKPTKIQEVDDYSWNKDQSRWSLWTIIFRHVLLGDLTVYKVASDAYPALEDGYSLKYPIAQKPNLNRSDYFNDQSYRKEINGIISSNGVGEYLRLPMASEPLDTFDVIKTNQAAQEYIDSMVLSNSDYALLSGLDKDKFKFWWDAANANSILRKDPKFYIWHLIVFSVIISKKTGFLINNAHF